MEWGMLAMSVSIALAGLGMGLGLGLGLSNLGRGVEGIGNGLSDAGRSMERGLRGMFSETNSPRPRARVHRLKAASCSKVPQRPSVLCTLSDRDLSSELPADGLTDGVEMVGPGEVVCRTVRLASGKTKSVCRRNSA
ncbi:hypothetical protein MNEG_8154 [Monoraphidium neglectum]|uniref:Uncharacterized protein n=1 Tax=Monoraphidium neglectum TaxID=145388 RepID=A0A0D2M950_9CHLO|nr:hypothetical protein MNEG_8154 [Monoraphidium neglectum]KIY99804.1 hypothetical protein MNEG_8154 [Monoraphidium neglectum]|eukprot:XP_013898824.1 hypothetical protein MNEG_8154 [Monoraphidium neglectum]